MKRFPFCFYNSYPVPLGQSTQEARWGHLVQVFQCSLSGNGFILKVVCALFFAVSHVNRKIFLQLIMNTSRREKLGKLNVKLSSNCPVLSFKDKFRSIFSMRKPAAKFHFSKGYYVENKPNVWTVLDLLHSKTLGPIQKATIHCFFFFDRKNLRNDQISELVTH